MFSRLYHLLAVGVLLAALVAAQLEQQYSWKQLKFAWPEGEAGGEEQAIRSGRYIPKNNLPAGLAIWQNKLFLTVPRWRPGVAATLNYIDLEATNGTQCPILQPYPNWEANTLPDEAEEVLNSAPVQAACSKDGRHLLPLADDSTLVSVIRAQVDACDRLWVLDSGLLDYPGKRRQLTANAIVIFDLKTDKLIRRYEFPPEQASEASFFVNIVVESDASDCSNAHAYLADIWTYKMLVYSFQDNHSHSVGHHYFYFDPLASDGGMVDNVEFLWDGGLFGMTLGPQQVLTGCRDMYFHALASSREFKVSNCALKNRTFTKAKDYHKAFEYVGKRGPAGQSTTEYYDADTDTIFYTKVNQNAIGTWNVRTPYTPQTQKQLAVNPDELIYPNDLKIDGEGNLWVLANKLTTFMLSSLDADKVNFRIWRGNKYKVLENATKVE